MTLWSVMESKTTNSSHRGVKVFDRTNVEPLGHPCLGDFKVGFT